MSDSFDRWETWTNWLLKTGAKLSLTDAPNQTAAGRKPFVYIMRSPASCEHDFRGWREFEDGSGGEAVCSKCGMGAMEHTLRNDPT